MQRIGFQKESCNKYNNESWLIRNDKTQSIDFVHNSGLVAGSAAGAGAVPFPSILTFQKYLSPFQCENTSQRRISSLFVDIEL